MFFKDLGIRFFKLVGLDCEQYRNNQYKKKEHRSTITFFSAESVKTTFIFYKCHRSIDHSII